ncbi:PREDICTED: transcription factor-like protein DPB [Tarenaya hassleriana]|uniref:transcription factor-like protein DPB n=1 Tax=Tarenaya hassleriana TaxID=28532 RepID=UPI00053C2EA1|nr:PREDICTED: transcription factor-like protein DPB [Tarenaya hassleriana]
MTTGSNSSHNQIEDGGAKNNDNNTNPGTRSWGTAGSGQTVSTSGSVGSPSSRSEHATMATPASDSTFLRMNQLDIQGDDAGSQGAVGGKKKKRGQRAVGPDKSGRGLRQFSMKVCEKVESKGRTTYNEVADELVAEFADPGNNGPSPGQQQYDEKNIRRRVYDALNVLMAMDIISKDKKEIQWKGLPRTSLSDIEELKTERLALRNRIDKKAAYLQELEEQYVGLQNLVRRNGRLYSSGNAPSGGVALPFILVQTRPHATVEVEISEDMQLVHFDFNTSPFELHDDNFVLKSMKFCERPPPSDNNIPVGNNFPSGDALEGPSIVPPEAFHPHSQPQPQPRLIPTPRADPSGTLPLRAPESPPIPGIIKARVKPES